MANIARAMVVGAVKTAWDFHVPILEHFVSTAKGKWVTPRLKLHSHNDKAGQFLLVRLARNGKLPVWKRAIHAPSESLVAPPKLSGPQTVKYVIQLHDAKRAGLHYDLRFMINGRGVSFAIPKHRMPNRGENLLAVLQPDHIEEYFDFEGIIPDGNKGAGSVEITASGELDIIQCDHDKIVFEIPDGPVSGRYVLIATQGPNWLFRSFPARVEAATKPNVKLYGKRTEEYDFKAASAADGQTIFEEKIDGACARWAFDKDGRVELTGPRISKRTGEPIRYTHKCPALVKDLTQADLKNVSGTGEIWHKRGPNFVAAILNSKPERARAMQRKYGPLRIKLFNVHTDEPYSARRDELVRIADQSGSRVEVPKARIPQSSNEAIAFARWCRTDPRTPRDGVVAKHPDTVDGEVWHKIKPTDAQDVPIVGFTEGNGKDTGRLGSLQVRHGD